jgi:hypothetical protein
MSKILQREDFAPTRNANTIVNSRFGQAIKVKMSKNECRDLLTCNYIMGEVSAISRVIAVMKENIDHPIDELIGELEIMETKVWNSLKRTKLGATNFNHMYVEDLSENKAINKHFVGGLK